MISARSLFSVRRWMERSSLQRKVGERAYDVIQQRQQRQSHYTADVDSEEGMRRAAAARGAPVDRPQVAGGQQREHDERQRPPRRLCRAGEGIK